MLLSDLLTKMRLRNIAHTAGIEHDIPFLLQCVANFKQQIYSAALASCQDLMGNNNIKKFVTFN
jgi:hypothetical protein